MQIQDELAHLWWQGPLGLSFLAWLLRREQTLHPMLLKLISFAGQRALGSVDFLRSLPWRFSKKDNGPDLLV
jgi:hypothetical protein